jgi:2-oxoglutarate dehydrogenase E1 component
MSVDTTVQVVMPQMGDSVAEGTVLEWHKGEGDTVEADETLVEISTDKVDAEVPAPISGTVVRIAAAEGDTVTVGSVLAEIAPRNGASTPTADDETPAASETPAATEAPAATETTLEIVMPQMGESVNEGIVLEWHRQPGESIAADETLVEISTDKVDAEVPAPASGTVTELLVEPGDTVTVGQVLARMSASGDASAARAPASVPAPDRAAAEAPAPSAEADHASPVARRAAAVHGVPLERLSGSGRDGRIVKADVLAAAGDVARSSALATNGGRNAASVAPAGAQPLKGGAAMLARYMDESRSIPTATSFRTLAVTTLDARRKQLKAAGHKVSYTHLIAYAVARAVREVPVMAHHFAELDGKPHRVDDGAAHLGLAVDVEKKDGTRTLMVPVIRNADALDFRGFLEAYDALVEKARTNTLGADDLVGGNITLTNPGGIGTIASVPRLMVGQGTIVATGSIAYPPGLASIGEMIGAEKVMSMTSTYDHRIIQGAESGRFLQRIERCLQGEDNFYDDVFRALDATLPPLPPPPAPAAAAAAARAAQAPAAAPGEAPSEELLQGVQAAVSLLKAYRTHGHLAARLDPLGSEPVGDPALDPEPLKLTPELMAQIPARILRMGVPGATFADALPHLRETYCGTMAYEIEHISSHRQRVWLREKIETGAFRSALTDEEQRALLKRLVEVDALERFMHKAYLGQKQFSLEGLDMTVPIIDELVRLAGTHGGREVVLGMAHRGRLNVLAHNLGRSYGSIFAEFEGVSTLDVITSIPQGGTGDVKYHHGARGSYELPSGHSVIVRLESNPSHLEYVGPVATGATRAAQTTRQGPHAAQDTDAALPIVLHGDAAFPAQGVVAETFNLQGLDGYTVGGSVHLIQNNQVGFTTDPDDARSTRWASDLAKGFDVPIIHVNGDDVAACVSAVRLAFAYRREFGHDVVIDLIGYRRWGHNEADEPAYTQPEIYTRIKQHPTLPTLYGRQLIDAGVVTQDELDAMVDAAWQELTEQHQQLKARLGATTRAEQGTGEYQLDRTPSPDVETAVDADRLRELNEALLRVPDGFTVHPKLARPLEQRREAMGSEGGITWAHAEALAFASLLTEGTPVRLTGQDTERGTFSQRHLVLHDPKTGQEYSPIQHLPNALAPMELHNSPLSEVAAVGFEYGYSQEGPETLVLWEAQFGDFVNGAQVIVDQFIVSGLAKWGQSSRLTLLLPHAYEGSGPEHSSARLERFLQLAAEGNIRIAYPSTPAQYFHLLRRQAKIAKQRPLVVMTPKSLLRLPQATNRIEHLADTQFFPVLPEPRVDEAKVKRLILCTGKVYYDLVGSDLRAGNEGVAIGRVELLYPFPQEQILELVGSYPNLQEVVWLQEEPRNMGARAYMSPRLMQILPRDLKFGYVGRPERASTAEGYPAAHAQEQARIISTALDLSRPVGMYPVKLPGER